MSEKYQVSTQGIDKNFNNANGDYNSIERGLFSKSELLGLFTKIEPF